MRKIKLGSYVTIGNLGSEFRNELFLGKMGTVTRIIEKPTGDEYCVLDSWFKLEQLTLVPGGQHGSSRRADGSRRVLFKKKQGQRAVPENARPPR
jgi:hypothetical protein